MSTKSTHNSTFGQYKTLGHEARAAANARYSKAQLPYRTPPGDVWKPRLDGRAVIVSSGITVDGPFILAPRDLREAKINYEMARVLAAEGYRKAIAKKARELAVAAGPAYVNPAIVVKHSPLLRGVIKRLTDDFATGRLAIDHVTKARIQSAVNAACTTEQAVQAARPSTSTSNHNVRTTSLAGNPTDVPTSLARANASAVASTSTAQSTPTFFESVATFFSGKRKRSVEDSLEDRVTKRRVVESCVGSGRDNADVSTWMPGAYEPRPTPAASSSTSRPNSGTARVRRQAKNSESASARARTKSGRAGTATKKSITVTRVAVDLAAVERAVNRLDDYLIFFMIDQILNH